MTRASPNRYCEILEIPVPRLEQVVGHREANNFGLLVAALLERGGPLTLAEAARRFAEAGAAASPEDALASLQRSKPARSPVYREGDLYHLDPHDYEARIWAVMLDLRPRAAPAAPALPVPPGPDQPATVAEIEEALADGAARDWSAQRLAVLTLEATGRPMTREALDAFWQARGVRRFATPVRWIRTAAVREDAAGSWTLVAGHPAIVAARQALRVQLTRARRAAANRPDPAAVAARPEEWERRKIEAYEALAELRRVAVRAFPPDRPALVSVALVDRREVRSYDAADAAAVRAELAASDCIAAEGVRPLLRALGVDPGDRRLVELSPPQKSWRLNRAGRTLRITTTLLIQGSCGISRPLGDPGRMRAYLETGQHTRLRRRLEADAKALAAFYLYGCLHGAVRLRWGFLDEMIYAPWTDRFGSGIHVLRRQAMESGGEVEVVVGSAPAWDDPWARARRCTWSLAHDFHAVLVDPDGRVIEPREVQLARVARGPGRP